MISRPAGSLRSIGSYDEFEHALLGLWALHMESRGPLSSSRAPVRLHLSGQEGTLEDGFCIRRLKHLRQTVSGPIHSRR